MKTYMEQNYSGIIIPNIFKMLLPGDLNRFLEHATDKDTHHKGYKLKVTEISFITLRYKVIYWEDTGLVFKKGLQKRALRD